MKQKNSAGFLRADDSVANVVSSGLTLRNTNGKAYRMIGSLQAKSEEKMFEERLEKEINLKEKQIAEATEERRRRKDQT